MWKYHLNVSSINYIQIDVVRLQESFRMLFWGPCEIICEDFPGIELQDSHTGSSKPQSKVQSLWTIPLYAARCTHDRVRSAVTRSQRTQRIVGEADIAK